MKQLHGTCLANPVSVVVVKTAFWCQTFPVQSLPYCHHMGRSKILKLKIYSGFQKSGSLGLKILDLDALINVNPIE